MNKKLISLITMTAITMTSVSPAFAKNFDSKQNVALDHAWTVNFNQKVNLNEAFEGVYIKDSKGNKIPTRVDFSDDHTKMIIKPTDGYAPNSIYTLNVEGVSNEEGKPLSDKATMQFTTANTAQVGSFHITSVTTNNGQGAVTTNLDPNSSFSFQLSKNVDTSTLNNVTVTVTDKDGNKANVKVEAVGNVISISPDNAFQDDTKTITVPRNAFKCNTTYTINLNGLKSTDEQDIGTKIYSFTTRDYKLNPTINGICNDDYISFGNQYANELWNITSASGRWTKSLQKCHDNNGTLVLDPDYNNPDQIVNTWNPYANLQNRNIVNLQVELRKQYKKILAKNSSYAGYNVGFRGLAPDTSYSSSIGKVTYEYMPNILDSMPAYTFRLFSLYKSNLAANSISGIVANGTTTDLTNAFKNNNPQVALEMSSTSTDAQGNLSRLAMYQSLYCMFGDDYAGELYDYIVSEENAGYDSRHEFHTKQIGNITIYDNNGIFLFKY